jgi:hypothetical protein
MPKQRKLLFVYLLRAGSRLYRRCNSGFAEAAIAAAASRASHGQRPQSVAREPRRIRQEHQAVNFVIGIVLLVAAVGMLLFGRARAAGAQPIPLMNVWAVGQLYVMVVLVAFVIGGAFVISNWPL